VDQKASLKLQEEGDIGPKPKEISKAPASVPGLCKGHWGEKNFIGEGKKRGSVGLLPWKYATIDGVRPWCIAYERGKGNWVPIAGVCWGEELQKNRLGTARQAWGSLPARKIWVEPLRGLGAGTTRGPDV